MADLFIDGGAEFSECRTYRYLLWRKWSWQLPLACVLLNPSVGDEHRNDPTNERCERRARAWGFGGVTFTNLFPYVAANPKDMLKADDPIGPPNKARDAILDAASHAGLVLCGWGNHGLHKHQGTYIKDVLEAHGIELHILRLTGQGQPEHPLYVPYDVKPVLWRYELQEAAHG